MKWIVAVIGLLICLLWGGCRIVEDIQFDRGAEGYLKRAADANTVELAEQNLAVAVKFLEENNITSGYTSILWRTPDEDVGFWHKNLTSALQELRSVKPEASQLEKTNVLMKLRETLLDQGESGTKITVPSGISIFPDNKSYALMALVGSLLLAGGCIAIGVDS